ARRRSRVALLVRQVVIRRLRLELAGAGVDREAAWERPADAHVGFTDAEHLRDHRVGQAEPLRLEYVARLGELVLGGRDRPQLLGEIRVDSREIEVPPRSFEQKIPALRDRLAAPR